MPSYTPNMNLLLPDRSDYVSLMNYLNSNFSLSDAFIANLKAELEAEIATLDGNAVKNVLGIAPDASGNVTFDSSNVKYTAAGTQSVKDLIDANGANITSIGNTVNGVLTDLGNAQSGITDLQTDVSALETDVSNLKNLGHFLGSFPTYADVPTNTSGFTGGIVPTLNDVVDVLDDETHGDTHTRYTISGIAADGTITYAYIYTYTSDTSGLMPKVTPPPAAGTVAAFNADGTVRAATNADITAAVGSGTYMPLHPLAGGDSGDGGWITEDADGGIREATVQDFVNMSATLASIPGGDLEPRLPSGGTINTFLRGDKTWQEPPSGGGKRFADFVIGSTLTHTAAECDYLVAPSGDLGAVLQTCLDNLPNPDPNNFTPHGKILVLNGEYMFMSEAHISNPVTIDFCDSPVVFTVNGSIKIGSPNTSVITSTLVEITRIHAINSSSIAIQIGSYDETGNYLNSFEKIIISKSKFNVNGAFFSVYFNRPSTAYNSNRWVIFDSNTFDVYNFLSNACIFIKTKNTFNSSTIYNDTKNFFKFVNNDVVSSYSSNNFIALDNSFQNGDNSVFWFINNNIKNIFAYNSSRIFTFFYINPNTIPSSPNLTYKYFIIFKNNLVNTCGNLFHINSIPDVFDFSDNTIFIENIYSNLFISVLKIYSSNTIIINTQNIYIKNNLFSYKPTINIGSYTGIHPSLLDFNSMSNIVFEGNSIKSSHIVKINSVSLYNVISVFNAGIVNFNNNSIDINLQISPNNVNTFLYISNSFTFSSNLFIKNNDIKVSFDFSVLSSEEINYTFFDLEGNTNIILESNTLNMSTGSYILSNNTNFCIINIEINYAIKSVFFIKNNTALASFKLSTVNKTIKLVFLNISGMISNVSNIYNCVISSNALMNMTQNTKLLDFYAENFSTATLPGSVIGLATYKTAGVSGLNSINITAIGY